MEMSVQNGIMPRLALKAAASKADRFSPKCIRVSSSEIFGLYTFIPKTAQKLIWKPEDNGQNGSARVITSEARLRADSQSLPANTQTLIMAALVTESLHPVIQPIRIQNRK